MTPSSTAEILVDSRSRADDTRPHYDIAISDETLIALDIEELS
ncbi:MAG TPA: hypothetical protein VK116_02750 [Planctomycetota bacterium]|nr:hypothetical protein [Planctomycetota bacterium]